MAMVTGNREVKAGGGSGRTQELPRRWGQGLQAEGQLPAFGVPRGGIPRGGTGRN